MQAFYPILKSCTLFDGFTDEELAKTLLQLGAHTRKFEKAEVVRSSETPVTEIGIVLEGAVNTEKIDVYGNRHILAQIAKGRSFGESLSITGDTNSPIAIVAADPSTILFLNAQKLVSADLNEKNDKLTRNLVRLLAEKIILLQIKTDILSQKTIREKLLLYFEYESKTAHSKTFHIHFSREDLADFLCLNASALSRELSNMQADGLLTFKRNRFTLT